MDKLLLQISSSPKSALINECKGSNLFFTGVSGSLRSFIISYLYNYANPKIIYCSNDRESLFKIKDDIEIINGDEAAEIYLSRYDEEYENEMSPLSIIIKKLSLEDKFILLFQPESLEKHIISQEKFKSSIIRLNKLGEFDFDELISKLNQLGFNRKKTVVCRLKQRKGEKACARGIFRQ